MFQEEHSAILLTCIKLPFVFKIFVLSIFEWPFYTGFTVLPNHYFTTLKVRSGLCGMGDLLRSYIFSIFYLLKTWELLISEKKK